MEIPISNSTSISTDSKAVKSLAAKYVSEIKRRLSKPQQDFKTEANDLFGYNGSNIDVDLFTQIFHKYQQEMGLSHNIIAIFDDWLLNKFPQQITSRIKVTDDGSVRYFDNVTFAPPFMTSRRSKNTTVAPANQHLLDLLIDENMVPMYPRDAVKMGDDYSVTVYVDVYIEPEDLPVEERKLYRKYLFHRMEIAKIPILKGSYFCWLRNLSDAERVALDECFNDPLGYLVIKGSEKVGISQQKLASSQMLVYKTKEKPEQGKQQNTNQEVIYKMKDTGSLPSIRMYLLTTTDSLQTEIFVDVKNNHVLKTKFHQNKSAIPTFMIFFALEILSNPDIPDPSVQSLSSYAYDFFTNDIIPKINDFIDEEERERVSYHLLTSISDAVNRIEELSVHHPDINPRELILSYIRGHEKEAIVASRRSVARMESRNLVDKIRDNIFGSIEVNDPGSTEDFQTRKTMLAKMVSILARVLAGLRPEEDRDSWFNNRVHTIGRIHEKLFNPMWRAELDDWKIPTGNPSIPGAVIKTKKVTDGFRKELVQGSPSAGGEKTQITDAMKRETPMSVYSQLQRVTIKSDASARLEEPRQLHPTQLGYICSGETPEGAGCGRIKHLTTTCWIAIPRRNEVIIEKFADLITKEREDDAQIPLMFNGIIQGWIYPTESYPELWSRIKKSRDTFDVCVTYNRIDNHIDIFGDGSRPSRPLLVVDPETSRLKFDSFRDIDKLESMSILDMVEAGLIEFVHINEMEIYVNVEPYQNTAGDDFTWVAENNFQRFIKIAEYTNDVADLADAHVAGLRMNEQPFTHSELIPYGQFGIPASCIPAAAHNHGPRITYQSSMSKQALSSYHSVHAERFDTSFKRAIAPTRTYFETGTYQPIGLNAMPSTDTPIVAFLARGVNNEDSIVVKKEFLDSHFNMSKYTTHIIQSKPGEKIGLTPEEEEDKHGINHALWKSTDPGVREDFIGLPKIGAFLEKGDVLLGRVKLEKDKDNGEQVWRYIPSKTGIGKEGYVDRVDVVGSSTKIIRIKVVQYRRQISGDKMASRFSQKGTFGLVVPANRLPRIASGPNKGLVPDFFVNPHSIPSRMTQGWIIEILTTKAAMYTGQKIDASPFVHIDIPQYQDILVKMGMDKNGEEEMIHHDGTPLETKVFIGACAYQMLKHHVLDKFQRRDVGKPNPLTHQPAAGRINEGGLKFGEMEHDAVVSHGVSAITLDRLLESSDIYPAIYCFDCGNIVESNFDPAKTVRCRVCNGTRLGLVKLPFINILITRNFMAIGMHIHLRFE